jgi:hypothetical protein
MATGRDRDTTLRGGLYFILLTELHRLVLCTCCESIAKNNTCILIKKTVLFNSILFNSISFNSILFNSILVNSILFNSILFNSFRPHYGHGVDSTPSENEHQELSSGKGGRCVRLKIWEPILPGTLWATPDLLRDSFTFSWLLKPATTLRRVMSQKRADLELKHTGLELPLGEDSFLKSWSLSTKQNIPTLLCSPDVHCRIHKYRH